MRHERRPGRARRGHSLFLKLLLVLLAAAVLVNVCVGGFFRMMFSHRAHAAMRQNLAHYAEYLARDIGSPPDTALARALARDRSLAIRYEGPGGAWATEPGLEGLAEESRHRAPDGRDGERMGWNRGRYYVQVERDGARYLFATGFRQAVGVKWPFVAALIGLLSLILVGTWLAIRRLLRPLRDLTAAVEGLGNGELGRQVPAGRRRDELGELARSFNGMSTRLKEMVRGREQLLLDVSHELKTPLTRIKVALELGRENLAAVVRRNVGEMETMVSELLETARLDSGPGALSLMPVDLAALVRETAHAFQDSKPGIRADGVPAGLEAVVDGQRVRTVLRNLLENALKYSGHQDRPVEVSLARADGAVVLSVRDYGHGIPEADRASVFEPFYRVDKSRNKGTGGYGLGLSLCRKIVQAHGGEITLASREDAGPAGRAGTTVTVRIPG